MFQVNTVRPRQAAIPFGVARQDEHMRPLGGFLEDAHDPHETSGVGRRQHVFQCANDRAASTLCLKRLSQLSLRSSSESPRRV